MFDKIVNWKLLVGSHDFPGPDGGTCINEAAIIAAGFECKAVKNAKDCPPCFSRPIAAYAIGLNDKMPDDLRNELLMPFVTRLSGTADSADIEKQRYEFIVVETVKRIISVVCEKIRKRDDLAEKCRNVKTLQQAAAAAAAAADYAAYAAAAAAAAAYAAAAADYADAVAAAVAAADAAADAAGKKEIFTIACEILDGAIRLGKNTELELCEVLPRLEQAKRKESVSC